MLELSAQTDTLTVQLQGLKKSIGALQANQADLAVKLDSVSKDVNVLTETLKDAQQSNSRLSSKLDDLGAVLSSKVSTLGETLSAQQKRLLELREEEKRREKEETEKKRADDESARKAAEAPAGPAPSQLYHSAVVQLNQKRYDLAAQGFSLYLEKYPKGEVADLANYYLGQALQGQKNYEEAARQFALVLDRYPKSDLTPAARLKYAACLVELKQHLDEAKRYLQSIPEDFPDSPEAKLVPQLLKDLEKPSKR